MDHPPPLPYIPYIHNQRQPQPNTNNDLTQPTAPRPLYTFEAPPPSYQRERTITSLMYYPGRWTAERHGYCQSSTSSIESLSTASSRDEEGGFTRYEVLFLVVVFVVVATFGVVGGVLDGRGRAAVEGV
ncbi:hypothetical protein M409DRAFT_17266 [Zasmidium cellare ATCC 36951]|uniref:Uncharacterized protein n=1 Tax=Zasmidium cellare ATCC 36951 TaxID=1080233 RepID=A0A6A6D6P3_ZASCE|nr:uncharacterized protein M409DRAFT_17266 [Zasmidium cellare ATCC 36951]KAF2173326.1 hypothetical protein M409DRAFT_17266 [Zasmidium cellare ATCC 36951]